MLYHTALQDICVFLLLVHMYLTLDTVYTGHSNEDEKYRKRMDKSGIQQSKFHQSE